MDDQASGAGAEAGTTIFRGAGSVSSAPPPSTLPAILTTTNLYLLRQHLEHHTNHLISEDSYHK